MMFFLIKLPCELVGFGEALASTSQSTWQLNPKEGNQNCYCRENVKYQIMIKIRLFVAGWNTITLSGTTANFPCLCLNILPGYFLVLHH
jgi:hypothetical protein